MIPSNSSVELVKHDFSTTTTPLCVSTDVGGVTNLIARWVACPTSISQ